MHPFPFDAVLHIPATQNMDARYIHPDLSNTYVMYVLS
jgi:hypothetical protein